MCIRSGGIITIGKGHSLAHYYVVEFCLCHFCTVVPHLLVIVRRKQRTTRLSFVQMSAATAEGGLVI